MQGPKANKSRQLATDLRKTHFTLGTADARSKNSEYVSEYQRKQATLEESQKNKLNLKASHFTLGNQTTNNFLTVSQKDFKQHDGFNPSKLNEEKKRDLRASHFVLGNHNSGYASLNNLNFPEKHIPLAQSKYEQEVQKNKMRKHNHNFTETNKKLFSSEYNSHFNKQNDPSYLRQALTARELQQKVIDLRKSHVVLGEDFNPMKSIAQVDYQSKQGSYVPPANDNVAIRRTNFKLGTDTGDIASMYQQNFVAHPNQKAELQGELISDLRATHFSLGQEDPTYSSHMGASYRGPPTGFKPPETLNPNLQKNHFTIGIPNIGLQNKTTYSQTHRNFGEVETSQARNQAMDRGSHFKLGRQSEPWISESQQHFKAHDGAKAADLEQALKNDLRSSHFKFSDVKPNSQFKTLQQVSYGVKKGEVNKLDDFLKKDLQRGHFQLGSARLPYKTSSGEAHQDLQGKASKLDPNLAKDLRANHFTYGDGKWPLHSGTEYRANFFWKNNEDS